MRATPAMRATSAAISKAAVRTVVDERPLGMRRGNRRARAPSTVAPPAHDRRQLDHTSPARSCRTDRDHREQLTSTRRWIVRELLVKCRTELVRRLFHTPCRYRGREPRSRRLSRDSAANQLHVILPGCRALRDLRETRSRCRPRFRARR
jgi:hypothetical protein